MTNNEFNMKLSSYSGGTLWFKIHLFFIIPLNIIINTASLIMFITQLYTPEMHRAYLINPNRMILISGITIIVSLVIIGIYAYSFYNLRRLTLNGYKVYLTFMLINLVLKNIIITVSTLAESNIILPIVIQSVSIMLIFTIMQIGIWWIPNYIYFKKRKSLFSNVSPAPIPKQNIQQIENFKNVMETKLCIKCKQEIPADALYCRHCGKKQTKRKIFSKPVLISLTTILCLSSIAGASYITYQMTYETAHSDGYHVGYNAGKDEGYQTGKDDGYTEGFEAGKKEGYENGRIQENDPLRSALNDFVSSRINNGIGSTPNKCLEPNCIETKCGSSQYCIIHKCHIAGCDNGVAYNSNYCYRHR